MISYTYIKGKLVQVPQSYSQAVDVGWHKSVATPDYAFKDAIWIWCKENFDVRTFKIFEEYIPHTGYQFRFFFLQDQDATLCNLKWL